MRNIGPMIQTIWPTQRLREWPLKEIKYCQFLKLARVGLIWKRMYYVGLLMIIIIIRIHSRGLLRISNERRGSERQK